MSATVEEVQYHQGICYDCNIIAGPFTYETEAIEWAAEHDAENHETDTIYDDAYEQYKEATRG